jgi:hypothetical protein
MAMHFLIWAIRLFFEQTIYSYLVVKRVFLSWCIFDFYLFEFIFYSFSTFRIILTIIMIYLSSYQSNLYDKHSSSCSLNIYFILNNFVWLFMFYIWVTQHAYWPVSRLSSSLSSKESWFSSLLFWPRIRRPKGLRSYWLSSVILHQLYQLCKLLPSRWCVP